MSGRGARLVGAVAGVAAAVAGVLLWAEGVHALASRRVPARTAAGLRETIVVFGFGNRGLRANAANRFRVRAGLRSLDPHSAESKLVLTGGAVAGPVAEAVLMADAARAAGYDGPIVIEDLSRSTWQNVVAISPLVEHADVIRFVSHPVHAEKARRYLRMLRPDLADRLARAEDYRVGELGWISPLAAAVGLADLWRHHRRVRTGWRFSPSEPPRPPRSEPSGDRT